jgi:hypothetical protein
MVTTSARILASRVHVVVPELVAAGATGRDDAEGCEYARELLGELDARAGRDSHRRILRMYGFLHRDLCQVSVESTSMEKMQRKGLTWTAAKWDCHLMTQGRSASPTIIECYRQRARWSVVQLKSWARRPASGVASQHAHRLTDVSADQISEL